MNAKSAHAIKKFTLIILSDVLTLAIAALLASLIDSGTVALTKQAMLFLGANLIFGVVVFAVCGLYRIQLPIAGMSEAFRIIASFGALSVFDLVFLLFRTVVSPAMCALMLLLWFNGVMLSRFATRIRRFLIFRFCQKGHYTRVMVVGGGSAGSMIIREMKTSDKLTFLPVCVIDDDPVKHGTYVNGIPVVGDRNDIVAMARRYEVSRIFVAMPSVRPSILREICAICAETGCRVQILPGLYQMLDETVMMSRIRDVDINDLLGRDPVRIDNGKVLGSIKGKTVLVTGGGGSIGSELCRQIAGFAPRRLIIFDIYENNAYEIEQELCRTHPDLDLRVLIGSVRDKARVENLFETERPDIVFHAAAHKHVPLMEHNPGEAVKNNVLGTRNVAQAAAQYGTGRFVLISTDKAVNPTNVMGATKRICEIVVQDLARRHPATEFVAVRFGNVLGSNGSVIPLFKRQIAEGGPVTVTHKDIIRYFMTIPEAVSLVLQAGAFAGSGEIFVLDMGAPVKILSLAENLIRLSGYRPYDDIPIVFTGLRPGEKLYEELLMEEEGLRSTENELIHIGRPLDMDGDRVEQALAALSAAVQTEGQDVRPLIKQLVPTFTYTTDP
ncbi:MAG: polysaccharide biosynthesis protein [Clostridia bacterium]|nr:polysaccharide biosynthesis protein [Clostridia bacterium]